MGLFNLIRILPLFIAVQLFSASPSLYYAQQGQIKTAVQQYLNGHRNKKHDFELLQLLGLAILDSGSRQKEPQTQLMATLGAAISNNERAFPILERAFNHSQPEMQLVAINLISNYDTTDSNQLLHKAMRSDYLPIRFEAAHQLALRKEAKAYAQLESLMHKLPKELTPLFSILFSLEGSPNSLRIMHKLMAHPSEIVRVSSILAATEQRHDELIDSIRRLAKQSNPAQQEACAYAIGKFHDSKSIETLHTLATSPNYPVALAALKSLYLIGEKRAAEPIIKMAKKEDLFAIYALSNIEEGINTLCELVKSPTLQVKIAAALALLEHRHPKCLIGIPELLISDIRDYIFEKMHSIGKTHFFWKAVPSAHHKYDRTNQALPFEISLALREEALAKCIELPQKDFLDLAELLFETNQTELVPLLVKLLENMQSDEAIAILKKFHQKAGAPLVRHYCTLALFRLNQPGPYENLLHKWVLNEQEQSIIQLRPFLPFEARQNGEKFEVTPEETSQLLIGTLEAFSAKQTKESVDLLLEVIKNGHSANKYALAGLLLRTVQ